MSLESVSEGWVKRDREATSYSDQLIYKSNQGESMARTSFNLAPQSSKLTISVKDTEDTTHSSTGTF